MNKRNYIVRDSTDHFKFLCPSCIGFFEEKKIICDIIDVGTYFVCRREKCTHVTFKCPRCKKTFRAKTYWKHDKTDCFNWQF